MLRILYSIEEKNQSVVDLSFEDGTGKSGGTSCPVRASAEQTALEYLSTNISIAAHFKRSEIYLQSESPSQEEQAGRAAHPVP